MWKCLKNIQLWCAALGASGGYVACDMWGLQTPFKHSVILHAHTCSTCFKRQRDITVGLRIDKTWTFHSSRIIELFGFGPTLPAKVQVWLKWCKKGKKLNINELSNWPMFSFLGDFWVDADLPRVYRFCLPAHRRDSKSRGGRGIL